MPVLFAAPGGVGAAHAGWRGLSGGVLDNTVQALCEATGCEPPAQMLWSRSSTFHRLGTYLRVMEVFSPLINSRRVQKSD